MRTRANGLSRIRHCKLQGMPRPTLFSTARTLAERVLALGCKASSAIRCCGGWRAGRKRLSLCPSVTLSAGGKVYARLGSEATIDLKEQESHYLARVLASLEPAGIVESDSRELLGDIYRPVKEAVERCLGFLEEKHRLWLHDDHGLVEYLRITVAAALRRIDLGYPKFVDKFSTDDHFPDSPVAHTLAQYVCDAFIGIRPSLKPGRCIKEMEEAVLALEARMERRRTRQKPAMRVKILCYEGLGMANYLRIIAEKSLPQGTRIDSLWENEFRSNDLNLDHYDMLISTFPLKNIDIPQVLVTPDQNQRAMVQAIQDTLRRADIRPFHWKKPDEASSSQFRENRIADISLASIISVIQDFRLLPLDPNKSIIDQAVGILSDPDTDNEQLKIDFSMRKEYGSVVFEEYGIRLLHCRSSGISSPKAGVLQSTGEEPSLLVIASPAGSSAAESRVLSEIVINLSEDLEFPVILSGGTREEIQSSLFRHFGRMMGL